MFDFFKKAISETNSNNGVVLHSDLVYFRKLLNKNENIVNKIFLESKINSLYLPTFSYYAYNIRKKKIFNINNEAFLLGSLPNYAIKNKIGHRTLNPIHSYQCIGEYDKNLFKVNNDISFGKQSIFEYFCNENLLWCSLGCDENNGFTIFYHAEHLAKVPYRKNIILKRIIYHKNKKKIINYKYFSRKNEENINLKKVSDYLLSNNILKLKKINKAKIYYGNCRRITNFLIKTLRKDKYFYIN